MEIYVLTAKSDSGKWVQHCTYSTSLETAKSMFQEYERCPDSAIFRLIPIETLSKGDYFKKKPDAKKVWVKGDYNRFAKAWGCADFEDCLQNFCNLKKGTLVFIDFEF